MTSEAFAETLSAVTQTADKLCFSSAARTGLTNRSNARPHCGSPFPR